MFSKILSAILICTLLVVQACAPIQTTREEPVRIEEDPVIINRQSIKGSKKFIFTGIPATPAELGRQLKIGGRPVKPDYKVMELQKELWGHGDLAVTMTNTPLFVEMDGGDQKRYRGMIPAHTLLKLRKISGTQELIRYQVVEIAGCANPVHNLACEITPGQLVVEKIYRTREYHRTIIEQRENKWNYVLVALLSFGAGVGAGYFIFGGRGGGAPFIPPIAPGICPPGTPGGR